LQLLGIDAIDLVACARPNVPVEDLAGVIKGVHPSSRSPAAMTIMLAHAEPADLHLASHTGGAVPVAR
jgi:hypothetical protein